MEKFKIGILGATTRKGRELVRLLSKHPVAEITAVNSAGYEGRLLGDVCPSLRGLTDRTIVTSQEVIAKADVVFNASDDSDGESVGAMCIKNKCVFIDLSPSFRITDEDEYTRWYGAEFAYAGLHDAAIFGLPELMRDTMPGKVLVGCPGIMATAGILALAPALLEELVSADGIFIDAKVAAGDCSGLSSDFRIFGESDGNCLSFSAGEHRETAELDQLLTIVAGKTVRTTLVPNAMPVGRGCIVTCCARGTLQASDKTLQNAFNKLYANEKFIRVLPAGTDVSLASVIGTNFCDISMHMVERTGTVVITAALDSLGKGSAGQAVQCMNALLSMPEHIALIGKSITT